MGGSRKGEKMCEMTKEVGSQKHKGQMQMWTKYKPWCPPIKDDVLFRSADKVTGLCLEEKTQTLAR
jgi:hypothetical protein